MTGPVAPIRWARLTTWSGLGFRVRVRVRWRGGHLSLIPLCAIISQVLMIPIALGAKHLAEPGRAGLRLTLVLGYLSSTPRAAVNASSSNGWVLLTVGSSLDAVGAGVNDLMR